MNHKPYTIRIFVPSGDPEGIRIIDRMNWTGHCMVIPRELWPVAKVRPELKRTGVYILFGYANPDDELPTIYVGESDDVQKRMEDHLAKDFWDKAIAFTALNNGLNKAHVRWLEHALLQRAKEVKRSLLFNGPGGTQSPLSEAEAADVSAYLDEALQILPLVGLRAFEVPKKLAVATIASGSVAPAGVLDTIVVPAQAGGFEKVFLGENAWHAIRIAGGKLDQIKYIAAYRTAPDSAITHYASVASIEPYGDESKYKINFSTPAIAITPIPFADAPSGSMKGPRYTALHKLLAAKKLTDIF